MTSSCPHYESLRADFAAMPVVDTHDHSDDCGPRYDDPIDMLVTTYFEQDLVSALGPDAVRRLHDRSLPPQQRQDLFAAGWRRAGHTGYAQVLRRLLRRFYGIETVSPAALDSLAGRLLDVTDPRQYTAILDEARLVVRLTDLGHLDGEGRITAGVTGGTLSLPPRARLVIGLPRFHAVTDAAAIQANVASLGRTVTGLDEYVAACGELFRAYQRFGAVAFKDQSAYRRSLVYDPASRGSAEAVFNDLLADPRRRAGYPDALKPLDDYLFHTFMRLARDLDLPVQLHTGHMAGCHDDIRKGNARFLRGVLELHRETRFDLLHANWPYAADLLYLVKNYENVALNFAWAHTIDPVYCIDLVTQAVAAVPHGKVHAYGSDYCGMPDRAWAHSMLARDNLARGLAQGVGRGLLGLDEARAVGRAWLFDNPNAFYRLGLTGEHWR